MLFTDAESGAKRKRARLRALPDTPETGWRPPVEPPNLAAATAIAFDVETREDDFDNGPGWARGKGHIVGVSLAAVARDGSRGKWYFPVRHEVDAHLNLNPAHVFPWLARVLGNPKTVKIGANLIYDVGWLAEENVLVNGFLNDVQFAEALLNESGFVNLEHIADKYLGKSKRTDMLYDWCARAYGGKANDKQRENIYRASPLLVGPYAEDDADLPIDILGRQWPMLEAEGLTNVYCLESELIIPLVRMRRRGVRVDLDYTEQLYTELGGECRALNADLNRQAGFDVNVNSSQSLARVFSDLGVPLQRTAAGAPSFTADILKAIEHPVAQIIRDIREREKIRSTFLRNYILEKNVNGRVHCSFHPLRGDDDGTRSGRFSSADPNLQNIPSRTELGKRVRKAFVSDVAHFCWQKSDYSQIEYRCLAHFAVGPGSDELRRTYCDDPTTDYHRITQATVKRITGLIIPRPKIKNINFGLLYGMGKAKLTQMLQIATREADEMFNAYHEGNPYVSATMDAAAREVNISGHITTIMGRRSRFDLWEPRDGSGNGLPLEKAVMVYGQTIRRAHTHKAINRRLQGSAADMMKEAMRKLFASGVVDVIGVPLLTVHDELDWSVPDDTPATREAFAEVDRIMSSALRLRVPVLCDHGRGPSWGAIE